jgi:hypothetical protein
MKTTVELSDALAEELRRLAGRERRTFRELLEEALRDLVQKRARRGGFKLRRASFNGQGLQPEFADGHWNRIRDAAYEGRGA